MSALDRPTDLAKRLGRTALDPILRRLDALRAEHDTLAADHARVADGQERLAVTLEQTAAATARLEAYVDYLADDLQARFQPVADVAAPLRSLVEELDGGPGGDAGAVLRGRFERAEAAASQARRFQAELAHLRSSVRMTHVLLEQAVTTSAGEPGTDGAPAPTDAPDGSDRPGRQEGSDGGFAHAVPSFDLLYRSFEDRHRGDDEMIAARQSEDYLDLLRSLPNPDLPVADLGCGRGELVHLLDDQGIAAVGVDANLGQLADTDGRLFDQDDLFRWLDARPDASLRAVVAMHVVEHVPLELQIRLVFEARRVLADGGLLVLETPNSLSISTAATNFWVDPTHHRPIHPMFLEFLAIEAGFADIELRPLHEIPMTLPDADVAPDLVAVLQNLILGHGDMALLARR